MTGRENLWTSAVRRVLKLSESGNALYTELGSGHVVREWRATDWAGPLDGTWSSDGDGLTVRVGEYRLAVPSRSHGGVETNGSGGRERFFVAPIVETPGEATDLGLVPALLKVNGAWTALAELLPGGTVREYHVGTGWGAEVWGGTWADRGSSLAVDVGPYRWAGTSHIAGGYFRGSELQQGGGVVDFPAILVAVDPDLTRFAMAAPPDADAEATPLFEFGGYTFFRPVREVRGHFARLLEARKPSLTGITRYAAKCAFDNPGELSYTIRELDLARSFSGKDGLITVHENFRLPDDPEYGDYRGSIVQIQELGETDLGHYLAQYGRFSDREVVGLARDLSGALEALHDRFKYVHSDLHLGNVIGMRAGEGILWQVADFNTTTRMEGDGLAPLLGTADICRPPEAAGLARHSGRISSSYDVWSLGTVLLQCATGTVLPQGTMVTLETAWQLSAGLSPDLQEILAGCLAPKKDRWSAHRVHQVAVARFPGPHGTTLSVSPNEFPAPRHRPTDAVAMSSAGPGHLEQWFVDGGGSLVHRWWPEAGTWSSWVTMDPPTDDGVAAVDSGPRDVWAAYVLVADRDGGAWMRRWDARWRDWQRLKVGGVVDVALGSTGPGHLEAWAVLDDGTVRHSWTTGGDWSGWDRLHLPKGVLARSIAAGSRGGDQHVVVTDADGSLWSFDWLGSRWSAAEACGMGGVHRVSLASASRGHLEVWAVQESGAVVHRWWQAEGRWSGWDVMADAPGRDAVAVAAGAAEGLPYQVLCLTSDGTVQLREWHDGWQPWHAVGHA